MNPEVDSAYYLEILVESLGLLGKFKDAIVVSEDVSRNLRTLLIDRKESKANYFDVCSSLANRLSCSVFHWRLIS